jgi:hypothetical protein
MEPYRSLEPHCGTRLPVTERLADRVLLLPTGTSVGREEISTICRIIRTAAYSNAAITEHRGDVGEIGGSTTELFAGWEKVPEEFAEADDDGARDWRASAHILTDGREFWAKG